MAAAARSTINAHYTSAEVVTAIWSAVGRLGFSEGRILEPGIGSGNFLALRPDTVRVSEVVGVELDPTTAAIAQSLYPSADIRAESFADSRLPDRYFDVVVGNVPFAKVALHDRLHNPAGHSIHNHFLVKSLRLTRPGGLLAAVTSRWTMDALNPAARREITSLADLLGAVRLPAGAFGPVAGTDAVCDVVILRRREPDPPPCPNPGCPACDTGYCDQVHPGEGWSRVVDVEVDGGTVGCNEYFARHRHLVLGDLAVGAGHYRDGELTVTARPAPLDAQLEQALGQVTAAAAAAGMGWNPAPRPPTSAQSTSEPARRGATHPTAGEAALEDFHKEGSIIATPAGGFAKVIDGRPEPFAPTPKSARGELRALVELRDAAAATLAAQAVSGDDTTFGFAQRRLNRAYDTYAARFGPLNRFKLVRTGRADPATGEDRYRRADPTLGGFRSDPDLYTVLALEVFDPETQTARKAPIFTRRVVGPRPAVLGADSPAAAMAVCLDQTGTVELPRVADLLGVGIDTARAGLGDLVFEDPDTGDLVPAGRYLAGDVRTKLDAAADAVGRDDRFATNVTALRAVLPVELGPEEIRVRLGVPWIDASDVAGFAQEVLGADRVLVEHAEVTAMWAVEAPTWQRRSVAMTSEWGTRRADAITLLGASLEQRPIKIYDTLEDGRRVVNSDDTLAAREKQEAIEGRFAEWIWENPERRDRLVERYNRRFNSIVAAAYDGAHLTLPGLAESFTPHRHQRDAVWRIISEPNVLLGHAVGAGKTATMVMAGMELRRLGLVNKPAYVVPNHMLDQFANELLQLYPTARVLVADRNATGPAARKQFVGRCATGDWDAVILTHSSFERIPVSNQAEQAYIAAQMAELRKAIDESNARSGLTVKRLEAALARAEERQKKLLDTDKADDGVSFEQTGIDYLFVDEAHAFKRLAFATHIDGISGAGSQRASDLDLKLAVCRERHGERVATFATATFVTNTLAEMYVMQRYLQPDDLEKAGLRAFDAWAATFGRTVTALELAPDGGSYRFHTRFARFVNVPELLTLFARIADVRTAEQLNLPTPTVAGDGPETVVVAASAGLEGYVEGLVARAERVRSRAVHPAEDNMLKVTGDGRKAALDLRLVNLEPDPDGGKLAAVAQRIAAIAAATRHNRYTDLDGGLHPRAGSLQLVFCDLSTPAAHWNAYDELRTQLVALGLGAEQVRFIHDAKTDKAKADLFAACRDGRVAVLIGSTEKMGVGTNVQARAVALHHVDCPWRPTDIDQREGRLIRQGNQNPQVEIFRYVTQGSFDVYTWQTVERKAIFIHQVSRGEIGDREIDDIGDQALSAGQVKALATGNPLIMERAGIEADLAKTERLARAHQREQHDLANRQRAAGERAMRLDRQADLIDNALPRRVDTRADRFAMTVGDRRYTGRVDAGVALRALLMGLLDRHQHTDAVVARSATTTEPVGDVGGYRLDADITRMADMASYGELRIENLPVRPLPLERADLVHADPAGLVAKLENRILRLDDTAAGLRADAIQARDEANATAVRIGRPFEHHDHLRRLRARLAEIDQALTPADPAPGGPTAAETAAEAAGNDSPAEEARDAAAIFTPASNTPTVGLAPDNGGPAADTDQPARTPPSVRPVTAPPSGELSIHAQHHLYQRAAQALPEPPPTIEG